MSENRKRDRFLLDSDLQRQSTLNNQVVDIIAGRHGVARRTLITRIATLGLEFDPNSIMTDEEAQGFFVDSETTSSRGERAFNACALCAAIMAILVGAFVIIAN